MGVGGLSNYALLSAIRCMRDGDRTIDELAREVEVPRDRAEIYIRQMRDVGLIEKVGHRRSDKALKPSGGGYVGVFRWRKA